MKNDSLPIKSGKSRATKWSSKNEFDIARAYFPFSCVDLVVMSNRGIVLTMRRIEPYKGMWHLPGGIIHRGQTMLQKAEEVAERELRCKINVHHFLGVFENFHPYRHDISHCFLATMQNKDHKFTGIDTKFFMEAPDNTIPFHKKIIRCVNKNCLIDLDSSLKNLTVRIR